MSGGSQHNPNGRQAQLGAAGWSPLQMANLLARAPQAHMASDRGVTWHTPTPPAHLYHVPAPSPPDPLQAMKAAAAGGVYRHSTTPPEIYRHTPTPPDKHMMRHTPSPGDLKAASAALPPGDLFSHLGPGREKHRQEDVMAYARGGSTLDLSLGGRGANGASGSPAPPAHATSPALSVRDAPTINSLIARAQPRPAHTRVDTILERLAPSPVSPHSVIVHPRVAPTPSPPSSNEDSADSCGAPPGSKRKRKPEKTLRLPTIPQPVPETLPIPESTLIQPKLEIIPKTETDTTTPVETKMEIQEHPVKEVESRISPVAVQPEVENNPKPFENGEIVHTNGPEKPPSPKTPEPHTRRKARAGSSETLDDIAAVVAGKLDTPVIPEIPSSEADTPVTIDNLKNVLSSPNASIIEAEVKKSPAKEKKVKKSPVKEDKAKKTPKEDKNENQPENPIIETPIPPRRKSSRISNSETTNVPVESPSEAKPAETDPKNTEPTASSFVEVESELEKMFAGIEEPKTDKSESGGMNEPVETLPTPPKAKKRRKSTPAQGEKKVPRRASRASTGDESNKKKTGENKKKNKENVKKTAKKVGRPKSKEPPTKDAYDSGSNASSGKSRGPFIQIRGPRDSPLSVSVINTSTGEEEGETSTGRVRKGEEFRNGLRARGLHASTLGLRYDATTADATWLCAFCNRGSHKEGLGDLFGPYTLNTDCEEYRSLDEATRRRYESTPNANEVWFHEECAVWAPGLVAVGARVFGLSEAVWATRGAKCTTCGKAGAPVACTFRACPARTHVPCASKWTLLHDEFRATCPKHA